MSRLLDVHNFVADKLRWQTQVLLDVELTASARVVGCLIAHDLNVERGTAWRAQENMAIALGMSARTVKRGVAELAGRGYLAVRRSRGRTKTQQYAAMLLDAAEDHDSIDKVITARKLAASPEPERVTPVSPDASEKVSPVSPQEVEKVSPASPDPDGKVTSLSGKGVTGVPQSLEDSFTPPSPPSRANRVRREWGEPSRTFSPFPCRSVREAVAGRLGEDAARSWLDPHSWDGDSRTIVTWLSGAADKLQRDCGRELRGLGVTVEFDKARHVSLSRQPRPVMSGESPGLAA